TDDVTRSTVMNRASIRMSAATIFAIGCSRARGACGSGTSGSSSLTRRDRRRAARSDRRARRRGPRRLARRSDLAARRRSRRVRLLEPLVPDPHAPLARLHPIAKIVAALILMLALFITVDLVTSSVIVAALLIAARFSGLPPRSLATRAAPLLIGAASFGLFNALLSQSAIAGAAIA